MKRHANTKTRSKTKRLTRREKSLFAGLAKGLSITDAARAAGYSPKWPGTSGWNALQNIKAKAPNLFDRHGLDDDSFMEKHVIPALHAMETKAFQHDGEFVYSKPMKAWGPRVQMIALIAKMKGMVKEQQQKAAQGIRVVVLNAAHRPDWSKMASRPSVLLPDAPGNGAEHLTVSPGNEIL